MAGGCRIEEVSKVFRLNPDYTPGPSLWRLTSPLVLPAGFIRALGLP